MKKTKNSGFTLIELVVVMVIIGILAIISVPMYRNYIQRARASEGRSLVGSVAAAERLYYSEFGIYLQTADDPGAIDGPDYGVVYSPILDVDARNSTLFGEYDAVDGAGGAISTVITTPGLVGSTAEGITVVLTQEPDVAADVAVTYP